MEWWKDAIIYQVYPRSFQDSNGDGIGDLPGLIHRLDYIKALGAGAIALGPVYRSPKDDNGYDISDYREIDPDYGTMEDMEQLIAEARQQGIRILMDLVISHTSTQHYWFRKSREQVEPYIDYYYWSDGGPKGALPNNWTDALGEDCWEYDPERCGYYLHLFGKTQAELNYQNPAVLEEMKDIMRFWLGKGVAGFRCDANIFWKENLEDGQRRGVLTGREHYLSTRGTHEVLRQFREVWDEYGAFVVGDAVFVTPSSARDLCGRNRGELSAVFPSEPMTCDQFFPSWKWFKKKFRPKVLFDCLAKWQKELDWNALYLEDCNQPRSISRFGSATQWRESGKVLAALLLTLRGTPFIYQGEEIGMLNFDFARIRQINDAESRSVDKLLDRFHLPTSLRWKIIRRASRDNARTPFQWDATPGAGFSTVRPWLGVNKNCAAINLEEQEGDPDSLWNWYRDLAALRRDSAALRQGDFTLLESTDRVFAYRRALGEEVWTIALNFGDQPARTAARGTFVRSSRRSTFNGTLQPWEAVLLSNVSREPDPEM